MRKQDYLVSLIRSLDTNEKRFFKTFAGMRPGEKDYLRLFDALENEGGYDGASLSKNLNFSTEQLKEHKRYLNQVVLKSLRTMDDPAWKPPPFLKEMIDSASLFERGMKDASLALLEKTLEAAKYFESFPTSIFLLHNMQRTHGSSFPYNLEKLKECDQELTSLWMVSIEFNSLLLVCQQCHQAGIEFKNKEQALSLLKHPLLKKKPEQLLSLKAASCWFNVYQQVYHLIGDNKKLLNITRQMVAFYRAHPQHLDIDARGWIMGHISLAQVEFINRNYTEAVNTLDLLSPFLHKPPRYISPGQAALTQYYIKQTRVYVTFALGRYQESLKLGLELYATKDTLTTFEQYDLIHNLSLALLQTGNSKEAYAKLEELLLMGDELRGDVQLYIRPLIMLAQLDMEHYSLIPHLIKSTKSWMKRKNLDSPELHLFFHHAYCIAKAPSLQRSKAWQNLLLALEKNEMKDFNEHLHSLKGWLTSKKDNPWGQIYCSTLEFLPFTLLSKVSPKQTFRKMASQIHCINNEKRVHFETEVGG